MRVTAAAPRRRSRSDATDQPPPLRQALEDPDAVVIDVRNYNESLIGKFAPPGDKVLDPMMRRSTEFPQWVADNKAKLANKKVLMYCTGGVRCERASAYMGSQGIQNIYQLEGGIHRYLEECVLAPTPNPSRAIESHREPSSHRSI